MQNKAKIKRKVNRLGSHTKRFALHWSSLWQCSPWLATTGQTWIAILASEGLAQMLLALMAIEQITLQHSHCSNQLDEHGTSISSCPRVQMTLTLKAPMREAGFMEEGNTGPTKC